MYQKILRLTMNLSRLREVAVCYRETRQWKAVTFAYLGLRKLRFPYILHLRSGQTLAIEEVTDIVIFWLVFVRRHYPVNASDRVIVDIGANIGLFTIYAAREAKSSQILAVEPFPDSCQRLRNHVHENRLLDRVVVVNCAIAAERGGGEMDAANGIPSQYRRIDNAATATLNTKHRGVAALENIPGVVVEQKTLSDILDHVDGDVDLVKMNIHGSEYSVLMNSASVLRRVHRITVQYHEFPAAANLGKAQLFSYLEKAGLRVVVDRDTHRGAGLAVLANSSAI